MKKPEKKSVCKLCGKTFTKKNHLERYCSDDCRQDSIRSNVKKAHKQWYIKNMKPKTWQNKCRNCKAKIRSGNIHYCGKPECKRAYIRKYMMQRYYADPEFRSKIIESCKRYNRKRKLRRLQT